MLKQILLFILKIFHILYSIFIVVSPYIFNDIKILLFLILLYILTLGQWYLFNRCLLNDLEELLSGSNKIIYSNGSSKSFMTYFFEKNFHIDEKILFYFFTLIPIFNSIVCLFKIYYILNKSKIKKCLRDYI